MKGRAKGDAISKGKKKKKKSLKAIYKEGQNLPPHNACLRSLRNSARFASGQADSDFTKLKEKLQFSSTW